MDILPMKGSPHKYAVPADYAGRSYDILFRNYTSHKRPPDKKDFVDILELVPKGSKIIELGCGLGDDAAYLCEPCL